MLRSRTGEAGTVLNVVDGTGFDFERIRCERLSEDNVALNFLIELIGPLLVEVEVLPDLSDAADKGRLGVNGVGRVAVGVGPIS